MAVGAVVSVTTTATLIVGPGTNALSTVSGKAGGSYLIQNIGSVNVFLGGATVDDAGGAKGKRLQPGEWLSFDLATSDALYGIVASGTCDVDVLGVEPS